MKNHDEISAAFELLLEEIEGVVNQVNAGGSAAFKKGKHGKVQAFLKEAEDMTAFRAKVVILAGEWRDRSGSTSEEPPAERSQKNAKKRSSPGRLRKGARTPVTAFRDPILEVLQELGGRGKVKQVLDRVLVKIKPILRKPDFDPLPSDPRTIRWRNTAQWARNTLREEGLLKSDSGHGVWELAGTSASSVQTEKKKKPENKTRKLTGRKWIEYIERLHPNKRPDGKPSPHKACMLLVVLELIQEKGDRQPNRFSLDDDLKKRFEKTFKKVTEKGDQCVPFKPFWHLKTSGLWNLIPKSGELTALVEPKSEAALNRQVAGAALPDGFYEWLQRERNLRAFRLALVQRWLPDHPELAEDSVQVIRQRSLDVLEERFGPLEKVRGARALFETKGHGTLMLAVSARYGDEYDFAYWYTLKANHIERLRKGGKGTLAVVCGSPDRILLIPFKEATALLLPLVTSPPSGKRLDIRLYEQGKGKLQLNPPGKEISGYLLKH